MTICGVRYRSLESGAQLRRAADTELPPATLTCKITSVERDSSDSVSEQLQPGSEVDNIWCTNILADHPAWAKSPDHGKEVSGQIGMLARSIPSGQGTCRAGISSANNVDCPPDLGVKFIEHIPDISLTQRSVIPVPAVYIAGKLVDLVCPYASVHTSKPHHLNDMYPKRQPVVDFHQLHDTVTESVELPKHLHYLRLVQIIAIRKYRLSAALAAKLHIAQYLNGKPHDRLAVADNEVLNPSVVNLLHQLKQSLLSFRD